MTSPELTPCGRGPMSYACSGCYCGLAETQTIERLRNEIVWMRQRAERAETRLEHLSGVLEQIATLSKWTDGERAIEHARAAVERIDDPD